MRQGNFGLRCEPSSVRDLDSGFGASDFDLPLPFFFPLEDLSIGLAWTAFTSAVLPESDEAGLAEVLLEELAFCFPFEDFFKF